MEKNYRKELFEDLLALTQYIEKIGKTWTIDVLKKNKCYLIGVVAEDVSWIYEIDNVKG